MTKKNKKHIVIATAIIILVVALLIYRYYIPDMKPKKQFTPAAVEYTYDDSVTSFLSLRSIKPGRTGSSHW